VDKKTFNLRCLRRCGSGCRLVSREVSTLAVGFCTQGSAVYGHKTPKKKKKSKNKLKNLLKISKSEPKIKKGTPKPDTKKHCTKEEAKENCPAAPGFVFNEVKPVQSAS
jgi:hypothetical protein